MSKDGACCDDCTSCTRTQTGADYLAAALRAYQEHGAPFQGAPWERSDESSTASVHTAKTPSSSTSRDAEEQWYNCTFADGVEKPCYKCEDGVHYGTDEFPCPEDVYYVTVTSTSTTSPYPTDPPKAGAGGGQAPVNAGTTCDNGFLSTDHKTPCWTCDDGTTIGTDAQPCPKTVDQVACDEATRQVDELCNSLVGEPGHLAQSAQQSATQCIIDLMAAGYEGMALSAAIRDVQLRGFKWAQLNSYRMSHEEHIPIGAVQGPYGDQCAAYMVRYGVYELKYRAWQSAEAKRAAACNSPMVQCPSAEATEDFDRQYMRMIRQRTPWDTSGEGEL